MSVRRTERDKIATKARKMTSEAEKAEWRAAWLRLNVPEGDTYETAREAMLRALIAGKTIAEAIASMFPPCPVPLPPESKP